MVSAWQWTCPAACGLQSFCIQRRCLWGLAQAMGDKTDARKLAEECNVPVVPGSAGAITDAAEAREFASQAGYPVILKAAYGGGGRGMRVVRAGVLRFLRLE